MCKAPDRREFGRADDPEDLTGDGVRNLLRAGRDDLTGQAFDHDAFGAGIHQPHADGISANSEKGEMAQRKNAAIAPDHIHRDGHQTEAERLAQRLDERRREEADTRRFGQQGYSEGEETEQGDEPEY